MPIEFIRLKNFRAFRNVTLKDIRGNRGGKPWKFVDCAYGQGEAVTNELDTVADESQLTREAQKLESADILAIKGLAQFERFPAVVLLGDLIERWHLSDLPVRGAQQEVQAGTPSS